MTTSENIVKQYLQAMNSHDIEKIRLFLHPQYTYTGSDGQKREGIQAGLELATLYLNAFPDLKIETRSTYSSGNTTVIEVTVKGTQKGKYMDVNPTNRKVTFPLCNVIEVRDGKIYLEREYYDNNVILQQLGVQKRQTAHA